MARRLAQLAELDVTVLKGVGAKHADSLREAFGIETVLDLLTHYPRNYIDRSRQARLADLGIGEEAMVLVDRAAHLGSPHPRAALRRRWSPRTSPTARGHLRVTFFNQAWRERQLPPGTQAILFGKVDSYQGRRQMTNPLVDLVGDRTGRIIPIYPQSEKHRRHELGPGPLDGGGARAGRRLRRAGARGASSTGSTSPVAPGRSATSTSPRR